MAGQALYRKYRSADFTQVIGQDHVVKTLTAAIASGYLSHAYLFTGPRGVGKTSVARLLARALNCTSETGRPCNDCMNCRAVMNSSLDVVEIDAASNRSIDSIRDLRDKVAIAPTIGKYKVYIIDEVHMLTSEAFNALLKTLEEPPAHAVFILATTESHKIPDTIISRTQRFSFRPIQTPEIISHLAEIASAESVEVSPEALALLAGNARGSFRDAISAFDQMASSGQRPVTEEAVRNLLGYSDAELIGGVSRAIAAGDPRAGIIALADLISGGAQPGQLTLQLIEQWRSIMLTATGAADSDIAVVKELATSVSASQAAGVVQGLLEAARSAQPREALEAAVVIMSAGPALPVQTAPTRTASTAPTKVTKAVAQAPIIEDTPEGEAGSEHDPNRWPKVVLAMKSKNNSLAALLSMYPIKVTSDGITIISRYNFHRNILAQSQNRALIEAIAAKVYGRKVSVLAVVEEGPGKAAAPKTDSSTELITSALEILGGEVID